MAKSPKPFVAIHEENGHGLLLYMPDGTIIPGQIDIQVSQDLHEYSEGTARVTVTFNADVKRPEPKLKAKIALQELLDLLK